MQDLASLHSRVSSSDTSAGSKLDKGSLSNTSIISNGTAGELWQMSFPHFPLLIIFFIIAFGFIFAISLFSMLTKRETCPALPRSRYVGSSNVTESKMQNCQLFVLNMRYQNWYMLINKCNHTK